MRIVFKTLLVIFILILVSVVALYDYNYHNSFYHLLLFIFTVSALYIGYRIELTVKKLYELHRKWLGQG